MSALRRPKALVRLRAATAGDVDAVHAIERAAFSDPWTRASFVALLANPVVSFRVAEAPGGEVAGYVVGWHAADEAEIANIALAPGHRGTGIGALLLDAALDEAEARGCAKVFLEVRESNAAARGLYDSRGFVPLGRRRGYYRKPVEDALILGLALQPGTGTGQGADGA